MQIKETEIIENKTNSSSHSLKPKQTLDGCMVYKYFHFHSSLKSLKGNRYTRHIILNSSSFPAHNQPSTPIFSHFGMNQAGEL